MSEMRQDMVSKEWVIIAPGRAKRPAQNPAPPPAERPAPPPHRPAAPSAPATRTPPPGRCCGSPGIAHEFKSALATISGYAQILRSEASAGEQAECAEKIVQESRALTHLVTEFLRFARPLEFTPATVDLRALVQRTVVELREEMPRVTFSAEGEFGTVPGDDGLLRQALLNLARNAAQAAGGSGVEVHVILRGAIDSSASLATQRIAVLDNGPGIASADLPRIFMPFYTTKADGTGLPEQGLYTCPSCRLRNARKMSHQLGYVLFEIPLLF